MKPFVVALGLELGLYRPDTVIDTAPGTMRVGHNIVKDIHNYGVLDVAHVLQKSSNVGVTKIALNLPSKKFWAFYNNLGFGQPLETGFPGEANGRLADYQGWSPFEQATLSFGYGVSASTLQLARAYLSLANDGVMPMVSLVKRNNSPELHRIMSAQTAGGVRAMLEQVVTREGTALKAAIPGFRVAGKTGTVKKSGVGGYSSSRYLSVFAGMAPASKPRLVMVVMIDEPSAGEYYGGAVAAPVFSRVMEGALRLLNIAPDQGDIMPILAAQQDEPA
jgi:cell division protein FtsI (penicillin-binding protein 3)